MLLRIPFAEYNNKKYINSYFKDYIFFLQNYDKIVAKLDAQIQQQCCKKMLLKIIFLVNIIESRKKNIPK